MRTFALLAVLLFSRGAVAQCDTLGVLLELQSTTNLSGLLLGNNKCVTVATIIGPLSVSNDTLSIDTTGFGGTKVANNGVSDNEDGGKYRLGNAYMGSPDAPFTVSRKINIGGYLMYVGDVTDSTLLVVDGSVDRVGIKTGTPQRALHVAGEARIEDLETTTPTQLVGADANGDLGTPTIGTGLSFVSGVLTSTITQYTDEQAQDAVGNALNDSGRIDFTYNDAANTITADVIANSIGDTYIRQSAALSVIGRSTNTTGNVADISAGTDGFVLRRSGTTLGFGTVATAGIADDAVTYAKLQNVAANNVLLGNDNGAGSAVQELTAAEVKTLLGISGTANRFALWTASNTLGDDAAFTFDAANDRATFTGSVAGVGANSGILNLNSGALGAATTFLRMSGNVSSNMIAELINANNATVNANSIFTLSVGGSAAGDAVTQYNITGQMTHAVGIDNTDDRFKITPNSSTPGGTANMGIIVYDNSGEGNVGINKDFPGHPLDVVGRGRSNMWMGPNQNQYSASNVTFGTGAGTGPTLVTLIGNNNMLRIKFTTGTAPVANGDIFTLTYERAYPAASFAIPFPGNANAATDVAKFYVKESPTTTTFTMKANGTLSASTDYTLQVCIWGY